MKVLKDYLDYGRDRYRWSALAVVGTRQPLVLALIRWVSGWTSLFTEGEKMNDFTKCTESDLISVVLLQFLLPLLIRLSRF